MAGSLVFYAWGEPRYVFLMLLSILPGYGFGLLIEKNRGKRSGRICCVLSVLVSLSFLLYFKYADFFLVNFNRATGLQIPLLQVALPIGISFYTFQIISYTIDVYRGEAAQRNLLNMALYIAMFPQLIAGPIVRYSDIARQLKVNSRSSDLGRFHSFGLGAEGIRRFILGLAKKVLLANQLGELCQVFRDSGEKSVLFYWLYAVAFLLHVYFDFSGYSDMAIGLGKLFGFQFPENFNYPYISTSITEFWRRWHISLGTWFRDYVYIPLGGNRVGRVRQLFHILVVWALTGFWHGAEWNFMVWGICFALLLTVEKLWLLRYLEKSRILSHLYVLFFILLTFVIFNAENMGQAWLDLGGMFGYFGLGESLGTGNIPLVSAEALYCLRSFGFLLLISAVGATPLMRHLYQRLDKKPAARIKNVLEPLALLVLLLAVTAYLVDGSFNPFLYFRF